MGTELLRGVRFTLVTMALFGGGYSAVLWGIGRVAFPAQADGSLIRRPDGSVTGSRLVAQPFTGPGYVAPRPSAVDYNAAATGGSNHAVTNPDHLAAARQRLAAFTAANGVAARDVPAEMVTASGGGLDPHIPPAAAGVQVRRVAAARGVAPDRVRAIVDAHLEPPLVGLFGRARVNVLELNLALDAAFGPPPSGQQ